MANFVNDPAHGMEIRVGPPLPPISPASQEVTRAVLACLEDGSWARYDPARLERMEIQLAEWLGVGHALLVGSGTLALEVALHAVGVKAGGLVAIPAYDYPGNFHTVHALGAIPLLVDVQADSPQLCPASLEIALEKARKGLGQVQAVVVSHLYGGLANLEAIERICEQNNVPWVEDACQCFGATDAQGKRIGTKGMAGIFSFGGGKPVSVGRGGLLVTNQAILRQRAWLRVSRGSALATPSTLQLAALEAQLPSHDRKIKETQQWLEKIVKGSTQAEKGQFSMEISTDRTRQKIIQTAKNPFHFLQNTGPGNPVYYRIAMKIPSGQPSRPVLERSWALGLPMGEGFRAIHVGRAASRFHAGGLLTCAEAAAKELLVLDTTAAQSQPLAIILEGLNTLGRQITPENDPISSDGALTG
ncbi:MAG: DegT/DnrJ/EryC1/StrS family aminotransferase [Planctomycetota bacterium]|nr:DegT/DnrJ/EryC1/StrS family aminotransferase [Planctomycetota bacterium]